jgi:hypothetical protein
LASTTSPLSDDQPTLLRRLAQIVSRTVVAGYTWVCQLFTRPKTEAELRAEEKARRAKIRRALRGLPPEPDGTVGKVG